MTRTQRIVISLIIRSDLGILLLLRRRPYAEFPKGDRDAAVGVGLWELPGGGIGIGETPAGAGVREVLEETSILLDEQKLNLIACCAYVLETVACCSHRIHLVFETRLSALQPVKCSDEHISHKWVHDAKALVGLPMIAEIRDVVVSNLHQQ